MDDLDFALGLRRSNNGPLGGLGGTGGMGNKVRVVPVCLYACVFVCLCICLFVCLSVYLCICLTMYLSIYLCIYLLSHRLSVIPCVYPPVSDKCTGNVNDT